MIYLKICLDLKVRSVVSIIFIYLQVVLIIQIFNVLQTSAALINGRCILLVET